MNESKRWKEFNLIIDTLDLDVKEKGLLLIIFRYVNHKTGYANPSRALLKKLYGTNKNDVIDKVINSLISKGYLYRESGKGVRSKYFVKLGTKIEPSADIEPSSKTEPPLGTEIEPQKENKKKIKENIYSDLIKKYPGKKIKSVRDKKLPKILKEYSIEEIERCINRYAEECKGRDKKFILNESTFWNGRYIDYLDENFEEITKSKEVKEENTNIRIYDSYEY